MNRLSLHSSNFRLNLPELIFLEPQDHQLAHQISHSIKSEVDQWNAYLCALSSLGLWQWLQEHKLVNKESPLLEHIEFGLCGDQRLSRIQLKTFNVCLITLEHCLEEVIQLPQALISESPSHFYSIAEISEESQEVILKGILRHDHLSKYLQQTEEVSPSRFLLPLSLFDLEPHHLVFYCHHLDSRSIPLSSNMQSVSEQLNRTLNLHQECNIPVEGHRNKLSQWLQGYSTGEWKSIKALVNEARQLESSMRSIQPNTSRAKVINLGIEVGEKPFVLLINASGDQKRLQVLVQLHPTSWQEYLPSNVVLQLLSKKGRLLQEVKSRDQDNFIQLRSFQGEIGKCFQIAVTLNGTRFLEEFEL